VLLSWKHQATGGCQSSEIQRLDGSVRGFLRPKCADFAVIDEAQDMGVAEALFFPGRRLAGQTVFISQVTSATELSSNRFREGRRVSTGVVYPSRCASTIAPPIRSVFMQTGCSRQLYQMSMASRSCSDQRCHHRLRAARQSLCRVGDQRSHQSHVSRGSAVRLTPRRA